MVLTVFRGIVMRAESTLKLRFDSRCTPTTNWATSSTEIRKKAARNVTSAIVLLFVIVWFKSSRISMCDEFRAGVNASITLTVHKHCDNHCVTVRGQAIRQKISYCSLLPEKSVNIALPLSVQFVYGIARMPRARTKNNSDAS
jgi:hypothetical protein